MKILITGGASGLGEAITRRLAVDPENHVYFTFHHSEKNAKMIDGEFKNATSVHCNFQDQSDINLLQNKIGEIDIDVLINNAYTGDFILSHFHKTAVGDFLTSFESNILPVISITQSAIDLFRKKRSGKIITVLTSLLSGTAPIGSSVYAANKAYLAELSKAWANENKKFNISSNTVSPSLMVTGLTDKLDERLLEQMAEQEPEKKLLTVEEAANAVFWFVNAPQEITGMNKLLKPGGHVV